MAAPHSDPVPRPADEPAPLVPPSPGSPSSGAPAPDPRGPAGAREAMDALLAGNRRFVQGEPRHGHRFGEAQAAAGEPRPLAAVLGCVDPRVPPEAVFDQGFGGICVIRSAGLVLDRAVRGSIELAVTGLGVPLVMVLGHQGCRAVKAAIEVVHTGQQPPGAARHLMAALAPAVRTAGGRPDPDAVSRRQVHHTVAELRRLAAQHPQARSVTVAGGYYHLDSGRVEPLT